ncbi:MAG: efflux transporter, family, subunit [Firmicutes bacterium]|nr:efflux transporter, family, subunit [Bacillota bacterium]
MWEKINKKILVASIVVVLGIASGFWYYSYTQQSKTATNQEIATASRGKIISSVAATGTIKPIDAVDISAQVTALIKEIKVKENDYVKTGQVLAILDAKSYETTMQKAKYAMDNYGSIYKRYQYLHSIGAKSEADLEDAQLNYQTAVASYEAAQSDVEKTVLVSPMDGLVLGEPVAVGTLVTAGVSDPTVVMMIGDVSRKTVKVKVDETDIGKIKVGQSATFTVDAYQNRTFAGKVTKIGEISTSTTSTSSSSTSSSTSSSSSSSSSNSVVYYYVTLSVEDPEKLLKTEMTARVNIKIDEKDNALLIPLAALKTTTSGQYVMVQRDDGKTENIPVETGLTSNDKVEIISGLQDNDRLIISYTKSQSQSSSKQKDNGPPPHM